MAAVNLFLYCLVLCLSLLLAASPSGINVIASVRGKKIKVTAATVSELTSQVAAQLGEATGQHRVMFRGKLLSANDVLEDIGVNENDTLMVVRGKSGASSPPLTASKRSAPASPSFPAPPSPFTPKKAPAPFNPETASPEDMQKAMQAMDKLLDSNFLDEFFSNDEAVEQARLQMLENIDKYDQMMPGFKEQGKEMASDPVKWREAMVQAKEQILKLKGERDAMLQGKGVAKPPGSADSTTPSPFPFPADTSVDDFADEDEGST